MSHAQPCPSLRMGTATRWPCLALLERRESLGPRALACQGNRARLESVDRRGTRVMLGTLEILECQAPRGGRDCRENLACGAPWARKEKRVMAALPAPACRGRCRARQHCLGSPAPKESRAQKVWAGLGNRASPVYLEFKGPQD